MCPHCNTRGMTKIEKQKSTTQYGIMLGMIVVGLGIASCVPLCMDNAGDYLHKCSACGKLLGMRSCLGN